MGSNKCLQSKYTLIWIIWAHGEKKYNEEGIIIVGDQLHLLTMGNIKIPEDSEDFREYYFSHNGKIYYCAKY